MRNSVAVLPGTEIYAIAYSDCSVGGWGRDRDEVAKAIPRLREIGLTPMLLVRLRMRTETLQADAKS